MYLVSKYLSVHRKRISGCYRPECNGYLWIERFPVVLIFSVFFMYFPNFPSVGWYVIKIFPFTSL